MNNFPDYLKPNNRDQFTYIKNNMYLELLRKDIYIHILNEDENSYFDIDTWNRKHLKNDLSTSNFLFSNIIEELVSLGWKCKLSFNNTGLFIYSTEKPPPSCYDDEF